MGRPIKQAHERRTVSLPPVRLTAAEHAYVSEQAATAGLSLTQYMRTLALTERVRPAKAKIDAALLVELNKIGVNINQIAHARNSGRDDPAILQFAIDELVAIMRKVDAAL